MPNLWTDNQQQWTHAALTSLIEDDPTRFPQDLIEHLVMLHCVLPHHLSPNLAAAWTDPLHDLLTTPNLPAFDPVAIYLTLYAHQFTLDYADLHHHITAYNPAIATISPIPFPAANPDDIKTRWHQYIQAEPLPINSQAERINDRTPIGLHLRNLSIPSKQHKGWKHGTISFVIPRLHEMSNKSIAKIILGLYPDLDPNAVKIVATATQNTQARSPCGLPIINHYISIIPRTS